jgi:GT2 family glycosyltransferase
MKILHVIFSCNRIKYLAKALESHKLLDYGNHTVDKLIIDDYPRTRNPAIFEMLGNLYNWKTQLHEENLGLSVTWTQLFEFLKNSDYDYVLNQEDDVVLLEPIKIDDMIKVLESDEKIACVVLQRQPWYFHEEPPKIEETDTKINQFYYSKNTAVFSPMFTLYRRKIADIPFKEYWKFNLNEGMIMVYLDYFHQMFAATIKNSSGGNIIEHIGEEKTGRIIIENEPEWERFSKLDPNKTYSSRLGTLLE